MSPHARRVFLFASVFALLVLPLVAQREVPTPASVLGHEVGADFHLATYGEALDYFKRLDAASDRVRLLEVGRTSKGLPWHLALISSSRNLAEVERWRQIAWRLAHPEGLTDEEARKLAAEGRAIVHIDGGLHSTESATSQFPMQLAYDLVTGDHDPEIKAILDGVVLMLWFSINPDGHDMMANWYRSNLGTPFEVAPMVDLYQAYIGHDNNRDGHMLNMIESRVITRTVRHWEPQVLYNHHQTAPFPTRIWIPPFAEPVSTHVHPLMWRTVNSIGMAMAQTLEERGMRGATHMGDGFDNWYPGFMDHANNFHNVVSFLTETALFRYATPRFYGVSDFPRRSKDLLPKSLYSSPWQGGWWRLRDAVDYMVVASLGVLDYAAKYRRDVLYNRYQAGRDVIARFRKEPPYAWFIPQDQADPVAAPELLRRLAFNGIRILRATRGITHGGLEYPAGTWVVPMDQPFALFVRQLFGIQQYPDLRQYPKGPPDNPYDVAGWTLPLQMGVRVIETREPLGGDVRGALAPVRGAPVDWRDAQARGAAFDSVPGVGFDTDPVAAGIRPPAGALRGSGGMVLLDPAQNNTYRALQAAWRAGGQVLRLEGKVVEKGKPGVAGRFLVSGVPAEEQERWARDLALQAERTATSPGKARPVKLPRIGLYRPWRASIDEGWTRWVLERHDFAPISLRNADVRAGRLAERFDVIVLADFGTRTITDGHAPGTVPARYAGGIGAEGVRHLQTFVRGGGTLVCLNGSCAFAIDKLHLPVKNVTQRLDRKKYFAAGSILAAVADPSHPVMAGIPADARIFMSRSPVFKPEKEFAGSVLMKYRKDESPLVSGYLLGSKTIQGLAAALDAQCGKGHVVLLGFKPQWRAQSFATFKVLFNACLYNGEALLEKPLNPGFWKAPDEKKKAAKKKPASRKAG